MGQNCLASASANSILDATISFLSAFSFCLRISILVSDISCAIAGTAQTIRPARNAAVRVFMIIVLSVEIVQCGSGYCVVVNSAVACAAWKLSPSVRQDRIGAHTLAPFNCGRNCQN